MYVCPPFVTRNSTCPKGLFLKYTCLSRRNLRGSNYDYSYLLLTLGCGPRINTFRVAVISAENHKRQRRKRQRRKRQSVTAKREKSQTPKSLTATLILPNLT